MENNNIIPIITYNYMDINKSRIISDNKRKCGVYRITNLTNSKSYIGSSNNLSIRFRGYFNVNQLMKSNMYIYKAILKYGYSNFSLDILEYCEPNLLIAREQYYLDTLKPEYNILKIAHSFLGFKHSLKTRAIMSINNTGVNHPLYGKNSTYETRIKIGKALRYNSTIDIIPNMYTNESKLNPLLLNYSRLKVKVFDQSNNVVNEFPSMRNAALYLNVSTQTMRKILNNKILHVGFTYVFEALNNRVSIYDHNHILLKTWDNISKASAWCNIPYTTLFRYIKSGKLYNNKYYFSKSECNIKTAETDLGCKQSEEIKRLGNTSRNRLVKFMHIKITNIETNVINYFPNNKEAAKYLETSERTLYRYKSKGKILLKKYLITNNIHNNKSYK